jgi:hypothetical protein
MGQTSDVVVIVQARQMLARVQIMVFANPIKSGHVKKPTRSKVPGLVGLVF